MALQVGDRLAERYRLTRSLGHGGMASVFLAEDERARVPRVLKQLRLDEPGLLQAFRQEFVLLARITHPNLVRVHDLGAWRVRGERYHYYTADWVDAETLAQWASRGGDASKPALDVLAGLSALHAAGVRHGDVSPDNVLVQSDGSGLLIDLGCARPFGLQAESVAGTPGFIAPELLQGAPGDARSDLYSLGQTLRWAHEASRLPLGGKLRALCDRLCASAPDARPSSAREALEALGRRAVNTSALQVLARELVGRDVEVSAFQAWLQRISRGEPEPRVFWMYGESGVGSSRLIGECVALAELEISVLRARGDERTPVAWLLATGLGAQAELLVRDMLRAAQELSEREEPLLLVLEDAHRLDPEELELLLAFLRSLPETSRVACLVSSHTDAPTLSALRLALAPLSLEAVRSWTSDSLSRGALDELYRQSRGMPAQIEALLLARTRTPGVTALDSEARGHDFASLLTTSTASERRALATLLALGGDTELRAPGLDAQALAPFIEAGWVRRESAHFRVSVRHDVARLKLLLTGELNAAHRALADWFTTSPSGISQEIVAVEFVYHSTASGDSQRAEAALRATEQHWRKHPRSFAQRLLPLLSSDDHTVNWLLSYAELNLLAGEFQQTLRASARLLRSRPSADLEARCRLLTADALLRLGRGLRAERVVERLQRPQVLPEWRARALERRARARLLAADPVASETFAEQGLALTRDPSTARSLRELAGLAASYLGRTTEAEAIFSELLAELPKDALPRERSRLLATRAIALFRAGQAGIAIGDYREALELADRHGLDDLVCVNSLNLGTAQQKLGDLGGALISYERGLRVAHALGRESTELTLRFNLGNLLGEVGDFARAEGQLLALTSGASPTQRARFVPLCALIRAEMALEQRDFGTAEVELRTARTEFAKVNLERELAEVDICRSELELSRGALAEARALAEGARTTAERLTAPDLGLRARAVLARVGLARSEPNAIDALERIASEAESLGERILQARLTSELYQAELDARLPSAVLRGARAERLWDQLGASLPEPLREVFWRDRRRAAVARRTRVQAPRAPGADADGEALRKLLSLGRRVNSSLSLERVFEYAVAAAIELTQAERCFLLLDEDGEPRVVAQRPDDGASTPPSRAIVKRVVESEEAVLTTDAESDQRFASPGSIHSMKLKSVLCVPVLTPSARIGLLYVDSRVQRARFDERERDLLTALGDQIAVAVANARLHRDVERQAEELAQQKRVIERLSRAKDRELSELRERVEVQERTLGLRYDYSRIVGRGPAMRRVFEQLDRITESTVDVLVQGESGTGKELVARALHQNGPRKAAPFIGINCAALPENLLESELFGHVRGAFSGADRDKRGLFVEANRGTLFLDEVGELPLSMQAKLLRVLQEREVRAVGSLRSVPIDVRLVSATHRNLQSLVESGRFREDLFYRLAVVVVTLPPLRERVEDMPLIARAILERLAQAAGRDAPELSNDALKQLALHPFPGNVRELENALTRAFVLRAGPRITSADLELTKSAPRRSKTRREFEGEERELIVGALRRTHWNVSLVSRELGIPRNTLYRKLRRYGLSERPE